MASKLAVVAALFVCFLVAEASLRVTTTIVEEEYPEQQKQYEQCREQVQRQSLQSCHSYVSSQQQGIQMYPQEPVQQCCQELQQVQKECRCEALEQIQEKVQQEQQKQGPRYSRSSQQQKIQQQVRQIPQMCSIQVPQQCRQQMY